MRDQNRRHPPFNDFDKTSIRCKAATAAFLLGFLENLTGHGMLPEMRIC